MNLLHIITTTDVGGAEMHILSQVRGQVARGHRVRVVYLLGQGTLRPDFLQAGAQSVESVGKSPLALWRLAQTLGMVRPGAHTPFARGFCGALAATLWGKRKVLIAGKHNDERALQRGWVGRVHGLIGKLPGARSFFRSTWAVTCNAMVGCPPSAWSAFGMGSIPSSSRKPTCSEPNCAPRSAPSSVLKLGM